MSLVNLSCFAWARVSTEITVIGGLGASKREGISSFLRDHVQKDTSGAKRVSAVAHRTGMVLLWRSFGIGSSRK
jgi:hypothetical protein